MKNNKTVRAGSFDRNSNATAAGATEGGVELDLYSLSDGELARGSGLDLYSLSDGELAGVAGGSIENFSEFPPLGRFAVRS
jgi:hypothetical protein